MHRYRSHTCAQLTKADVGTTARLSGWVHRIRDHGGLLFIDLRDHYGLTQCVVDPDSPAFKLAETLRAEWVVRVDGEIKARTPETTNKNLPTGEVELFIQEIEVLGQSAELPLPVFGEPDYPEDIRLRYRFLDLRRETLHANIVKRTKIIASMRNRMTDIGFGEYSTPILTASSPEGARDFLVPSRIHPGKFFALPQAPQQYKQLLMVAGFDRYFQIAPCFRDEDPRADRLPGEFYQLDLEMSFVTQEEIWDTMEPVLRGVFEEFAEGKKVTQQFPRIPYDVAIRKYGTDKPDLRNPIEMQNVTDHFRDSGFKVFAGQIAGDPKVEVWAIPAPTGGSRAFCDRMNAWAQGEGQPGLGYIFFRDGEGAGPIARNIGEERTEAIRTQLGLGDGDAVFFVCGIPSKFASFAGAARTKVGQDLDLIDLDSFALCWIVDFPFYEWDEENKKLEFAHNPFSMPQGGKAALDSEDPLSIKAYQFDAVCNGYEIASGSIRNQEPETMVAAFEKVGLSRSDVEERFGGLYRAFQYGAPPHGGMAAGVDRVVMLLCGVQNLREITLFPMNQQAEDLLMGAPSEASTQQLRELHLRLNLPAEKSPTEDNAQARHALNVQLGPCPLSLASRLALAGRVLQSRFSQLIWLVVALLAFMPVVAVDHLLDRYVVARETANLQTAVDAITHDTQMTVQDGIRSLRRILASSPSLCATTFHDNVKRELAANPFLRQVVVESTDGTGYCAAYEHNAAYRALSQELTIPGSTETIGVVTMAKGDTPLLKITQRFGRERTVSALVLASPLLIRESVPFLREVEYLQLALTDGTLILSKGDETAGPSGAISEDYLFARSFAGDIPVKVDARVSFPQVRGNYAQLDIGFTIAACFMGGLVLILALQYARKADGVAFDLERAIIAGEMKPYYQPVINLKTGKISGCEVLIRWVRKNGEIVPPSVFIDYAEMSGLAIPMTLSLMEQVRYDLEDLCREIPDFKISINLFEGHFRDGSIVDDIQSVFEGSGISYRQLVFEITERRPLDDREAVNRVITAMHKLGVRVAMDDAGTGHSNLADLQTLGIDIVKIDKIFVEMIKDPNVPVPVVDGLISMGRELGIEIVGEGVETQAQALYLRSKNVVFAQGYLFSPPLKLSSFLVLADALKPSAKTTNLSRSLAA